MDFFRLLIKIKIKNFSKGVDVDILYLVVGYMHPPTLNNRIEVKKDLTIIRPSNKHCNKDKL